jgi:4-hydroxy-4-methyl-2-oxoglutarate aldolase
MEKYVVRHIERPDGQLIEQFRQLSVSTVYEAQGKIGLMSSRLRPIIPNAFICGPAVTAVCYAEDNLMIHAAIEVCQPGDVLVVTTIGESSSGMIGELIVTALKQRGVQGVVIDAGIRDVAQIRELGFPIWSKAISPQGTTKAKGGWVNAPAICGGAAVHPGDLILADDDGVVVVRQDDLQTALAASLQRLEKEARTKAKIVSGELSLDFYGLREVLRKENVAYYENQSSLKGR